MPKKIKKINKNQIKQSNNFQFLIEKLFQLYNRYKHSWIKAPKRHPKGLQCISTGVYHCVFNVFNSFGTKKYI